MELQTRGHKYIKPPMRYQGNKYSSLPQIIPKLPYMDTFVDVFGGSGAVLLGRRPHGLEVYNDRFTGLTDFYRCIRDHCDLLVDRLNLFLHSREEWERAKKTWQVPDPETVEGLVERAARWFYTVQTSFAGIDRGWMRSLQKRNEVAEQFRGKIAMFPTIHARFQNVQIENLEWYDAMLEYDSDSTTFYLDPPYLDQDNSHYKHEVEHEALIDLIFKVKGFVALSGYPTPYYDKFKWSNVYEWQRPKGMQGGFQTEKLWIKD